MRLLSFLFIVVCFICYSCKKDSSQSSLTGQWIWVIQYSNNPAYDSTPQSTGIQEILMFDNKGIYSLSQNGIVTNTGTYKTTSVEAMSGQKVSAVHYTNTRISDSIAYYSLTGKSDTLIFSNDLIGTIGSGARYYSRQ